MRKLLALAAGVALLSFQSFAKDEGNFADNDTRKSGKLYGIESVKLNDDNTITVVEENQPSNKNSFELNTSTGRKVSKLIVKEGEEFNVEGSWWKFYYRLDKIDNGKLQFSVEQKRSKRGERVHGKLSTTYKKTITPY